MDQTSVIRQRIPLVLDPPPNITKVTDKDTLNKLIAFLDSHKEFGFDLETTVTKDFYWRRVRTMQFGNLEEQYVIDLLHWCDNDPEVLYNCQGDYGKNTAIEPNIGMLLAKLAPYLVTNKHVKCGINVSFEYECMYWLFGMRTFGYYDCMLAEKCIYAGMGGQASLKNYEFFGMEELMGRYFGVQIDKELQTSFTLDQPLSEAQYEYAALDTRTPLGIKQLQSLIANGETVASLKAKGKTKAASYLSNLDPLILGDNLSEVIAIENGALGSFVDMHVHGERIDIEKWKTRVQKSKDKLVTLLQELDSYFLPFVGSKTEIISDAEIEKLEAEWKTYNIPTEAELTLKKEIRLAKKISIESVYGLELQLLGLEEKRKAEKEILKTKCGDLKKKRTAIKNLADKCEGQALINYASSSQLLAVLTKQFKQLEKVENLDDDILEKFEHISVIKNIRDYHKLAKEIGTYGDSWTQEWKTGGSKIEGWIHPGDHRLHCIFNQLDAATGRSSSSQPNAQNLPQDKEVRSCFVADLPDEHGEKVLITADMAGAELRIIADDANDPIWINAFEKDEDVHSVGTELLYEEIWSKIGLPDCEYFKLKNNGEPQRKKCECPEHAKKRSENKSTNFLLAYGGGSSKLSVEIKKSLKEAKELMTLHEQKNPIIWKYLEDSGNKAQQEGKAFDLFGRRRLLPAPTYERAKENCLEYKEEKLRLNEKDQKNNIEAFEKIKGRKPNREELFTLTHRNPTANEISNSYFAMSNGTKRQGKNHRIQGTNATIAKLAMSSLFDENGKPYLWHVLPLYGAKLLKFVHDEFVVQCYKKDAETIAALIGDSFKRAAATKMKRVEMKFDYKIANYWKK